MCTQHVMQKKTCGHDLAHEDPPAAHRAFISCMCGHWSHSSGLRTRASCMELSLEARRKCRRSDFKCARGCSRASGQLEVLRPTLRSRARPLATTLATHPWVGSELGLGSPSRSTHLVEELGPVPLAKGIGNIVASSLPHTENRQHVR